MTYVIGVDCGTQSAKVVIYDDTGAPVSEGRQPLRPLERPRQGAAVHPDDDIWTAIGVAGRSAMAAFTGDPADIAGVGVCAIRCCKAFLDETGSLIEPVVSWMDERAYQPYVPQDPRLAYATTLSGYVLHRFSGRFVDTVADNITGQWPTDSDAWDWSDDPSVMASSGFRREQLFDLVAPGTIVGALTDSAARHTGFPPGIPVVATANDKAVEMLGAGAAGQGAVLVSLGTYIAAMLHGPRNLHDAEHLWTNFSCIPQRYLYESNGIRRGMWTVTWSRIVHRARGGAGRTR
jgi:sugar (pentulose or hexulose) kinase